MTTPCIEVANLGEREKQVVVATPLPPPSEGAVAQYSVRVYLYIDLVGVGARTILVKIGFVAFGKAILVGDFRELVEVRLVVRERKLGGFREGCGIFFGRNFGGKVGWSHGIKLVDFEKSARKKSKNFQVFNLGRNGSLFFKPPVAEVDEKTAIGAVGVGNATRVLLAVWQLKLNASVRARSGGDVGGGGELSHESKIADSRRNATKKIIFYFYFSCVFSLQVITRSFSSSYGWRQGRAP